MADQSTEMVVADAARVPMNVATITDGELVRMWKISRSLAESGMYPDAKSAAQAFAKIMLGRDLGLSPTQALTGIYIVKGKPQVAAVTMAGFIKKTPDHDYRVRPDHSSESCTIDFYVGDDALPIAERELIGTSTYTIKEAADAGLVKDGSGWRTAPRNMLFARAMSNGCKWYMPEVLGGVPVYYEGEIPVDPPLDAGSGRGTAAAPAALPTAVQEVVRRAVALGHVGLSNAQAVGMSVSGRDAAAVDQWVVDATETLDAFEATKPAASTDDLTVDVEAMTADELRQAAEALFTLAAAADGEEAEEMQARAEGMIADADMMDDSEATPDGA